MFAASIGGLTKIRWPLAVAAVGLAVGYTAYASASPGGTPINATHRADPGQFRLGAANQQAVDQARSFSEFPLLWVGEEFQGYPLTTFLRRKDGPQDAVYLIYGSCQAPPGMDEPSCVPPLEIVTNAPGSVPAPDKVADGVAGSLTTVRGVPSRVLSGSPFLWTGGVTITVHANSENTDAAIAALQTVNDGATRRSSVKPGESLAPLAR